MEMGDSGPRGDDPADADARHPAPPLEIAGRYRAIFAQVAEGIFLFEAASRRLEEANPAFLRLLGYTAAELAALTLYDLVAHDRASVDAHTAALIRVGRNPIGARDYRRKDGATVPVEVSATALAEAGGAVLCVVVRDLTARRQAEARRAADEARVREGELRLGAALDHAPLILFNLDRSGIVTFARGRGLAVLGLTAREAVGRSVFGAGQRSPEVAGHVRRALAGEKFDVVVTLGRHRFTTHYAPTRDESGAITGVLGVAVNSTRRLHAEAAVRRYDLRLTEREQETLALFAGDLTHGEIAARLGVGRETVRTYLRQIAIKLSLDTAAREAVVAAAWEGGLLDDLPPKS